MDEHRVSHDKDGEGGDGRALRVQLDRFAWDEIAREARRQGVSVEELARFALMYYLADLDRERVSRRVPPPTTGSEEPNG